MAVGSRAFWLPRRGNSPAEYEDAFAGSDASGRYALADGASEGCFTGLWARLLVEDFVSQADHADQRCASVPEGARDVSQWPFTLPAVQERWDADVRARKLEWDTDYWVEQGAFAAFLGVVLRQDVCQWQAVAVGDTCLFHTRGSVLMRVFPLDHSDQFSNRPQLVGSRMPVGEVHKRQRLWNDGCGQPGDRLWAMTDALAKWCLTAYEAGGDPWRELECAILPLSLWERGSRHAAG